MHLSLFGRAESDRAGLVYRVVGESWGDKECVIGGQIMGFPTPKVFVTADSVEKGKPDPEGICAFSFGLITG